MAEVTDTFGTDNAARPFGGDEMVELVDVECRTAVIDKSADAIFFHFTAFGMVVMMVGMALFVLMFLFIMVMMVVCFPLFFLGDLPLYSPNPSGGGGSTFKVEKAGADNLVQIHVGVIAFYDFGTGLQGADNLFDAFQLFRLHFCDFVQQDDVAELNLLDNEVFDIFVVNVFAG